MYVYVSSLDFDGCLYRQKTDKTPPGQSYDFVAENMVLIEFIKHYQGEKSILLIGSNRQSIDLDFVSGYRASGTCFTPIRRVSEEVGAEFDPFLLSDIYLDADAGHTVRTFFEVTDTLDLKNAILNLDHYKSIFDHEKISPLKVNTHLFFDEDKVNLLYAQLHKIATENNPEDDILFDFFDDKDVILKRLDTFFNTHPNLIPKNVTLRLFKYEGDDDLYPIDQERGIITLTNEQGVVVQRLAEDYGIVGTGEADPDYRTTVKHMGEIAAGIEGVRSYSSSKGFQMSKNVTPQRLEEKRGCAEKSPSPYSPAFHKKASPTQSSSDVDELSSKIEALLK